MEQTREFDTRKQAFEAARAFTGKDTSSFVSGDDDTYNFDGGWISDLGCSFEVNFNDGRKSENFWVKEKFTADEIRKCLERNYQAIMGAHFVRESVQQSALDESTKAALRRILNRKEEEARLDIIKFIPNNVASVLFG